MTSDELRQIYTDAVRIAQAELRWRTHVWRDKPEIMQAKTAEIKRLLLILETMKDALKPHCDYDQPRLLDAPRKVDYP
jgi:hypothetical protein